jgi:N-acetylmuramoyl-L-alanine amidase
MNAVKRGWIILITLALLLTLSWLVRQGQQRLRREPALELGCQGAPTPRFDAPRDLPTTLRGTRVMLNPGHGSINTDEGSWGFQRPQPNGFSVFVLEDDSNIRLARAVKQELETAGAVVLTTRELTDETEGQSDLPVWREAARHHLERIGVPEGIWNSRGFALRDSCNLSKDIRARPLYANLERADVMLSLHSNAGNPAARGTQAIYATRPFLRAASDDLPEQSRCLAEALAQTIPEQIRLERPWSNATVNGSNQYGENGFALMPSVILEVAFHTNFFDGQALRSSRFRETFAKGVRVGLEQFLSQREC